MQNFRYKALNKNGERVVGERLVVSEFALAEVLQSENLQLLDYKLVDTKPNSKLVLFNLLSLLPSRHKINFRQKYILLQRLHMLIKVKIPLLMAIDELIVSEETTYLQNRLQGVKDLVLTGNNLSDALTTVAIFDKFTITIIRTGEANGSLADTLADLCQWYRWQASIHKRLRKMFTYPLLTGVVVTSVLFFLMVFVVPDVVGFVVEFSDVELNLHTRTLVWLANVLSGYWQELVATLSLIALVFIVGNKNKQFRVLQGNMLIKLPIIGQLYYQFKMAIFIQTLNKLLRSNIGVTEALILCKPIIDNGFIIEKLNLMIADVSSNKSLADSFADSRLLTPLLIKIIKLGETNGNFHDALTNVSELLENQASNRLDKIEPLIEPLLTIFLALIIGQVVWAVLSPIWDLMGNIS